MTKKIRDKSEQSQTHTQTHTHTHTLVCGLSPASSSSSLHIPLSFSLSLSLSLSFLSSRARFSRPRWAAYILQLAADKYSTDSHPWQLIITVCCNRGTPVASCSACPRSRDAPQETVDGAACAADYRRRPCTAHARPVALHRLRGRAATSLSLSLSLSLSSPLSLSLSLSLSSSSLILLAGCKVFPSLYFGANESGQQTPEQLQLVTRHELVGYGWYGKPIDEGGVYKSITLCITARARVCLRDEKKQSVGNAEKNATLFLIFSAFLPPSLPSFFLFSACFMAGNREPSKAVTGTRKHSWRRRLAGPT